MKQSKYDPTLKEHFSEEEARRWIRHLEKIIEQYENREKYAKEKNARFTERHMQTKRKLARLITHLEFLQEKYPDIEMGLDAFIKRSKADQE